MAKAHLPDLRNRTFGQSFRRKNTEAVTRPEAKAIAAEWERAGSWVQTGGRIAVPAEAVSAESVPQRVTLAEALGL